MTEAGLAPSKSESELSKLDFLLGVVTSEQTTGNMWQEAVFVKTTGTSYRHSSEFHARFLVVMPTA